MRWVWWDVLLPFGLPGIQFIWVVRKKLFPWLTSFQLLIKINPCSNFCVCMETLALFHVWNLSLGEELKYFMPTSQVFQIWNTFIVNIDPWLSIWPSQTSYIFASEEMVLPFFLNKKIDSDVLAVSRCRHLGIWITIYCDIICLFNSEKYLDFYRIHTVGEWT